MNSNLINVIVKGRQDSKLKQSEVGKLLGIKGNTISDWERGRTEPDIDSFIKLCKIYDINPAEALNSVYGLSANEDFLLTKFETSHIKKYRTLDIHGKDMVDTVLDIEYDRCQSLPDQTREENLGYKTASATQEAHETKVSYLTPIAAHNDNPSEEQIELMNKDLEDL